jgi:hypothetical protein
MPGHYLTPSPADSSWRASITDAVDSAFPVVVDALQSSSTLTAVRQARQLAAAECHKARLQPLPKQCREGRLTKETFGACAAVGGDARLLLTRRKD